MGRKSFSMKYFFVKFQGRPLLKGIRYRIDQRSPGGNIFRRNILINDHGREIFFHEIFFHRIPRHAFCQGNLVLNWSTITGREGKFFDEVFLRRISWDGSIDIDIFQEVKYMPHDISYQENYPPLIFSSKDLPLRYQQLHLTINCQRKIRRGIDLEQFRSRKLSNSNSGR